MEHSHSSKPNTPDIISEPKPSKPLKVKGRYTPKSAPSAEQTNGDFMTGYQAAPGQSSYASANPYNEQGQGGYPSSQEPSGKLKHSGLGIASFILSMLALLSTVIGFIVIFASIFDMNEQDILLLQDPAYIEGIINGSEFPPFFVSILIGGLLMMGTAVLSFIGLILGFISLFIKQRKKVFGILGTIFNALLCLGGIILLLLSFIGAFAV